MPLWNKICICISNENYSWLFLLETSSNRGLAKWFRRFAKFCKSGLEFDSLNCPHSITGKYSNKRFTATILRAEKNSLCLRRNIKRHVKSCSKPTIESDTKRLFIIFYRENYVTALLTHVVTSIFTKFQGNIFENLLIDVSHMKLKFDKNTCCMARLTAIFQMCCYSSYQH